MDGYDRKIQYCILEFNSTTLIAGGTNQGVGYPHILNVSYMTYMNSTYLPIYLMHLFFYIEAYEI